MNREEVINNSFVKLLNWINQNGVSGYDPYDIKGTKPMIWLINKGNKNRFFEIVREVIIEFQLMFPLFFRKLFGVQKKD